MLSKMNSQVSGNYMNPSFLSLNRFCILIGISLTIVLWSTASADDSEIFFGRTSNTSNTVPNVLLVLDTSSSMNRSDGMHITRLERLKVALRNIVDSTSNVNMGIMRFNGSNSGGPILYPVTNIDKEWCALGDCSLVQLQNRILEDGDDLSESSLDNRVSLDSDVLPVGTSLEPGEQVMAIRFNGVNVPQGANILSAELKLTAARTDLSSAILHLEAEQSDDSEPFTGADGEVSDRQAASTGAVTDWSLDPWTAGDSYSSTDIAPLIKEVTDRAGWCGGNSITLFLSTDGYREMVSYAGDPSSAPTLNLSYDVDSIPASGGCARSSIVRSVATANDDAEQKDSGSQKMYLTSSDLELPKDGKNEQLIGIRFKSIDVPKGAIIESAQIKFQVDEYQSGSLSLKLQGEYTDDSQTFSSSPRDISNRPTTAAQVIWTDPPAAPIGSDVISPDISPIVQEIVNRGGWDSGNALSIIIKRGSGTATRTFESYNGNAAASPKIFITYQLPSGVGVVSSGNTTVKDRLHRIIDNMKYTAGSPFVDTYYEATQYFRGGPVDYGTYRGSPSKSTNRVSHPESYTGGMLVRNADCSDLDLGDSNCVGERIDGDPQYITPSTSSCQTNHIVLLSDGGASSNTSKAKIKALTGIAECEVDSGSEACGRSLSEWLYNTDMQSSLIGKQNIITYTIGFNIGSSAGSAKFLTDIAKRGGGSFREAATAEELTNVFQEILGEVMSIDTSFVAPGATVNQFNRLTHRNDIYFAVFKPEQDPLWAGNLKRYELGLDSAGNVTIVDANDIPAVDQDSGFFSEESKSYWSTLVDGNNVSLGGAASKLEFNGTGLVPERRTFTFTGDNGSIPSAGIDLTAPEQEFSENNELITHELLGITGLPMTEAELDDHRVNLIKWARGVDLLDSNENGSTEDWRQHMGDPMHSRPIIVNYGGAATPISTIFVSTNEGFLHAFERDQGKELFSFIPKELLMNIQPIMENSSSTKHPYGLDGSVSLWFDDINNNVTVDSGEDAYIYVGMRRGGNNYYAFDISSRENPKLAWVINGGPGGTPGFEELGQTWSKAIPTKMYFNGESRDVLVFSAGYDTNQDGNPDLVVNSRSVDDIGRGIFIVDARTGEKIWSGLGSSSGTQRFDKMDYSMPGDLRVIDVNYDGFTDMIFTGDMGGQLWRFDLEQYHASGNLMQGGVIADLNGPDHTGERRFYSEPDVSLIVDSGERFLAIGIGSGWRAHPLNKQVQDRFYMIKSDHIFSAPPDYDDPITEADLVDVTNELDAAPTQDGWYFNLKDNAEKVLSTALTINNQIVFSTYRPETSVGDCSAAVGSGAVYVVNVMNGAPVVDLDEDNDIDLEDREIPLAHGGIPPEPAALITEHGPTVLVGPEQPIEPEFGNLTQRSYWTEVID